MTKQELEYKLSEALAKQAQLQSDYDAAQQALLDEYERDSLRGDGSGAQERRREQHQQDLKNDRWAAQQAFESRKRVVQQLQQQLEALS